MAQTRGKRGAAITATKQFNKGKARRSTADDEKRGTLNDIQKRRTARQNNKDIIRGSLTGRSSGLDLGLVRGSSIRSSTNIDGNDDDSPATCFICNERLFGSLDDINNHIDSCLTNPQPTAHNNHQQHHSHTQSGYGSSGLNTPISNNGGGGGGGGGSATSSATATPTTASSNGRMGDSFEEYTWAGQTRVRVTSLFEGGMASLGSGGGGGGGGGSRSGQTDIDDDLNVDDDEEEEYGGVQFTERDIVMDDATDPDADELREIVIASSSVGVRAASPPARRRTPIIPLNEQPQQQQQQSRIKKRGNNAKKRKTRPDRDVDILDEGDDPGDYDDDEIDEDAEIDLEGEGEPDDEDEDEEVENDEDDEDDEEDENVDALIGNAFASGDTRLVIDALRAKIKHLESANRNVPSCLICLEPYTVPLTSIVCWHVHCEACWMKTLGSKKLCPQCQKITLPKDLRRIYI
ncbi:hypothetical protein BG004_002745 [Podila humilis]|nr:hypothetical protein BG004_002745 [Podila humilis]